ncbi:hypothetical protein F5148DRAFT_83597 [Russula earlei]|uniref:Uncharacterized protein n=1 Tax=Russula earlei TaxID=71964 RepID=A0ACC0TTB4_9AGAM|nr:hypothetical protein F5148DRAFT_83597 [Russula earlei]
MEALVDAMTNEDPGKRPAIEALLEEEFSRIRGSLSEFTTGSPLSDLHVHRAFLVAGSASSSKSSVQSAAHAGQVGDDRARRRERDAEKRSEIAGRLTRARESTLDYRLDIPKSINGGVQAPPNPVSMKDWTGLVEERIEVSRKRCAPSSGGESRPLLEFPPSEPWLQGQFLVINGRGKPLERDDEDHNPFIARENFLMNRIVQRHGAAPPWVEVQGELEAAMASFRAVLKQTWVCRAVGMLTLSGRSLHGMSLADARALRDREWEARERAYHESALRELNLLVRKYNALAP